MQNKQKVTLYLPEGIHKQLKVKAALELNSMSAIVEKAVAFYLKHPEKIEEIEASTVGKTHQVHICPECDAAMVMNNGTMVSLKNQPSVITEELPLEVRQAVEAGSTEGENLVTC